MPRRLLERGLEESEGYEREREGAEVLAHRFEEVAYNADAFSKLSRYGAGIERSLYRALHELQRLQATRAGQPVLAPAAVDVDVSVSGGRR